MIIIFLKDPIFVPLCSAPCKVAVCKIFNGCADRGCPSRTCPHLSPKRQDLSSRPLPPSPFIHPLRSDRAVFAEVIMSDTIRSSASVPAPYRKKQEEADGPGKPAKEPQIRSARAFKVRQSGFYDRIVTIFFVLLPMGGCGVMLGLQVVTTAMHESLRGGCLFLGVTVAWCLALALAFLLLGRLVEVCVQSLFRAAHLEERLPEDIRTACITVLACLAQYVFMLKGLFASFDQNFLDWLWHNNLYDSVPNPPALASVLSLPMFALAFVAISRAIAAIVKVIVMRA